MKPNLTAKHLEKYGKWLEEYRGCSCTSVATLKRELLGYCKLHGSERRNVYKLLTDTPVGHDKKMR